MPEPHERVGLLLVVLGVAVTVLGVLIWLRALSWFGSLPGDLRIELGDTTLFVPITSMVLTSIVLSFVLWLVRRWL